jgi:hypothetical protein
MGEIVSQMPQTSPMAEAKIKGIPLFGKLPGILAAHANPCLILHGNMACIPNPTTVEPGQAIYQCCHI